MEFKSAENDAKYYGVDENPTRECQWKFVQDAAGRIVYEVAYDKNDHTGLGISLFTFSGQQSSECGPFCWAKRPA